MTSWRGVMFVGCAVAFWSTAEVVIRVMGPGILPVQLAWVRCSIAAVLMLTLLPLDRPPAGKSGVDRRLVLHCLWMAVPGILLNAIGWNYALKYAGAGIVATGFGASPLVVFILSWAVLGEPLSFERGIGIVLGFVGLSVLSLSEESLYFSYLGLFFTMLSVGSFSVFTVCIKRFANDYAGLPLMALTFCFGALYLFPLAYWETSGALIEGLQTHWLGVLYISLFTTGLAYLLFIKGMETIDPTSATSLILLKPPIAALIAWHWAGEPLTWNLAVAIVFIVGGLYLVIYWGRRKTAVPLPETS